MAHTKQTISIIGLTNDFGITFANRMCEENFRIVIFDENPDKAVFAKKAICVNNQEADIDVVECKHIASWEADIIVISVDEQELDNAAKKIVDVSTQKIVAILIDDASGVEKLEEFEALFPHSKVSILIPGIGEEEITFYTRHQRALQDLQELITLAGYKANIRATG